MGIINVSMRLKDVIEKWAEFVRRLAIHRYGRAPDIRLSGHVGSNFPYITLPLGKENAEISSFFNLFILCISAFRLHPT